MRRGHGNGETLGDRCGLGHGHVLTRIPAYAFHALRLPELPSISDASFVASHARLASVNSIGGRG